MIPVMRACSRAAAVACAVWAACAAGAALVECGGDPSPLDDGSVPLPDREPIPDAGRSDAAPRDAASTTDAAPPEPACDPAKPFGDAALLPGASAWDPTVPYSTPRLSFDELTIYFTTRPAAAGKAADLGRATRPSRGAPFGAPEIMTKQSSGVADNDPSVPADHLSVWFRSDRDGGPDLWTATRSGLTEDFGAPELVAGTNVNTTAGEAQAYFRQAAGELWFTSNRAGGAGGYDVYVAARGPSGAFGAPSRVAELSSSSNDFQPQPSEDGLTVLLASNRDGGQGSYDLYLARRDASTAPFAAPAPLAELNTAHVEQAGWLSGDGCRIYFSSTRAGVETLYFAERPR
jgi:hypothetical protein